MFLLFHLLSPEAGNGKVQSHIKSFVELHQAIKISQVGISALSYNNSACFSCKCKGALNPIVYENTK